MEQAQKGNSIRVLERALAILDCVAESANGLSMIEIAEATDLSPSTASRILATLESNHYLYRDTDNKRFYLGYQLAHLSSRSFGHMDIRRLARPSLEYLSSKFHEGVGLYLLRGDRRVCIDRVAAIHPDNTVIQTVVRIGSSMPVSIGASGKVMMAYMPKNKLLDIVGTVSPQLSAELEGVRKNRYYVSLGEREPGLHSVASPIFNAKGEAIATIFISIPEIRSTTYLIQELCKEIKKCAADVSRNLGYMDEND